mmetsp:Transcript_14859/g.60759  ORF Transcript_14859/g.60759 Transcript_14859/m.60759 type:complete len:248 (+) Transcript_14859:1166-1909(+)
MPRRTPPPRSSGRCRARIACVYWTRRSAVGRRRRGRRRRETKKPGTMRAMRTGRMRTARRLRSIVGCATPPTCTPGRLATPLRRKYAKIVLRLTGGSTRPRRRSAPPRWRESRARRTSRGPSLEPTSSPAALRARGHKCSRSIASKRTSPTVTTVTTSTDRGVGAGVARRGNSPTGRTSGAWTSRKTRGVLVAVFGTGNGRRAVRRPPERVSRPRTLKGGTRCGGRFARAWPRRPRSDRGKRTAFRL